MAESATFDFAEYNRKGKAKMGKSSRPEIEEETPPAQPHQTPNSQERINPELLRAIVNGDLMGFIKILGIEVAAPNDIESNQSSQENNGGNSGLRGVIWGVLLKLILVIGDLMRFIKILGIEDAAPNDMESIQGSNSGNIGLGGVTCGWNTALHVVAGVMEKSSSTETFLEFMKNSGNSFPIISMGLGLGITSIVAEFIAILLLYWIGLLTKPLRQTFLFFYSITGIQKSIAAALEVVTTCWTGNAQSRKKHQLIEKENDSVVHKMTTYVAIATIIYHQDRSLLTACNKLTGEIPLHCAVKAGKLEMVSLLVQFAQNEGPKTLKKVLRAPNKVGETALHEAARSGYSDVVEELLRADENLESSVENLESSVDNNGISPLYLAVGAGCLDVVQQLIAPNREPSYGGPDEQTALHAAVLTQEENIIRAILEWKPALAAKTDKAQNTPLHYAALIGNTNAIKQLLLKDTKSVYEANSSGSFPVHLAAEADNFKVIKELLRTCPDVGELLDNEQRNFLHIAVEKKKIRIIMLACKEGINANVINAKDKDGNTPLHLAVINSESEIFALLCQNKRVNPHIRNDKGLTPLDLSSSLKDHQFTYSLNPQSIIHRALITRGAFQNPCQPDLSKTVNNFWKARADRLNQREGKEMWNGVEVDIEKESTKYENMSKSLITGAVLIASATFASIFTVSGIYRGDNTPHTLRRRNFFKAFIIVNIAAFSCAIVSTIWLLYSALSNFHLKYRKFYFKWCTSLFHVAINLFILTFGLGGYIAIALLSEWLALLILAISGIVILWNIIWNPRFVPLILLAPYTSTEYQ